jgi:hypothetical protein
LSEQEFNDMMTNVRDIKYYLNEFINRGKKFDDLDSYDKRELEHALEQLTEAFGL